MHAFLEHEDACVCAHEALVYNSTRSVWHVLFYVEIRHIGLSCTCMLVGSSDVGTTEVTERV